MEYFWPHRKYTTSGFVILHQRATDLHFIAQNSSSNTRMHLSWAALVFPLHWGAITLSSSGLKFVHLGSRDRDIRAVMVIWNSTTFVISTLIMCESKPKETQVETGTRARDPTVNCLLWSLSWAVGTRHESCCDSQNLREFVPVDIFQLHCWESDLRLSWNWSGRKFPHEFSADTGQGGRTVQIYSFLTTKKTKRKYFFLVVLALREGMRDDKQLLGNKIKSESKIMQFNMSTA